MYNYIKRKIVDKLLNLVIKKINILYDKQRFVDCRDRLLRETLKSRESGVSNENYGSEVIVSLTTYGKRINEAYISIESIMQGTLKPNRIILWLQDEYIDRTLPMTLQNQAKRGLEIRYCKDIKSYKKLIPALKMFPDSAIITIDDDLIYPYDTLENLIREYQKDSSYIYASRYHYMQFDNNGKLKPYLEWKWNCQDETPSHLNFVTTGAGTLFPPHCFCDEILNEDIFTKICPNADDVWVNAMALLSGVKVKKVFTHDGTKDNFLVNVDVQDNALYESNLSHGNDKQLMDVYSYYKLFDKLTKNV